MSSRVRLTRTAFGVLPIRDASSASGMVPSSSFSFRSHSRRLQAEDKAIWRRRSCPTDEGQLASGESAHPCSGGEALALWAAKNS